MPFQRIVPLAEALPADTVQSAISVRVAPIVGSTAKISAISSTRSSMRSKFVPITLNLDSLLA